nr:hypothetical protein [Tanacetum cinerariifolium]
RHFLPWKVNANLIEPKWICVYPCAKQWRGRSNGSDKETKCLTWVAETSDDDDDARSLWSSDNDEHFDLFEDDPTHLDARWSP